MILKQDHFALNNFEGSIDFLLYLIQKEEIAIYDIPIQELLQQFIRKLTEWESRQLDRGAEFISAAAYLVWLKSKMLLPSHEQSQDPVDKIDDPHFEVIHHLMDYCRFKKAAKELGERQEKQQACYFRGIESPEWKKPMGIDHVSLDDLAQLFKEMMGRAVQTKLQIHEENWRVSDKIHLIRRLMQEREMFPLEQLFPPHQSRLEIIVSFLALLELMKTGELAVVYEQTSNNLVIVGRENH